MGAAHAAAAHQPRGQAPAQGAGDCLRGAPKVLHIMCFGFTETAAHGMRHTAFRVGLLCWRGRRGLGADTPAPELVRRQRRRAAPNEAACGARRPKPCQPRIEGLTPTLSARCRAPGQLDHSCGLPDPQRASFAWRLGRLIRRGRAFACARPDCLRVRRRARGQPSTSASTARPLCASCRWRPRRPSRAPRRSRRVVRVARCQLYSGVGCRPLTLCEGRP